MKNFIFWFEISSAKINRLYFISERFDFSLENHNFDFRESVSQTLLYKSFVCVIIKWKFQDDIKKLKNFKGVNTDGAVYGCAFCDVKSQRKLFSNYSNTASKMFVHTATDISVMYSNILNKINFFIFITFLNYFCLFEYILSDQTKKL